MFGLLPGILILSGATKWQLVFAKKVVLDLHYLDTILAKYVED